MAVNVVSSMEHSTQTGSPFGKNERCAIQSELACLLWCRAGHVGRALNRTIPDTDMITSK